jgi:hypothetical protein
MEDIISRRKLLITGTQLKGVAKKNWCFKFDNFGLLFLQENDRCPFLLLGI